MNGLTIPKWALIAGTLLVGIVGATWGAATKVARDAKEAETLSIRVCRIEAAMHLEPWPTCPKQWRTP